MAPWSYRQRSRGPYADPGARSRPALPRRRQYAHRRRTPIVYALARAERLAAIEDQTTDQERSDSGADSSADRTGEISTEDAAALLECSAEHLRTLCRFGRLLGRKPGRRPWIIDKASLDAYRYQSR